MNTQTQNTTSAYEQQAIDFMAKVGATMEINYLTTGKHFEDDKGQRDIYRVTIYNRGRHYSFNFGNSINKSGKYLLKDARLRAKFGRSFANDNEIGKLRLSMSDKKASTSPNPNYGKPTEYDVLACLAKNDPGIFEDFCSDFGYDTDSRKAEKTYNAVKEEYLNVSRLFNEDELTEMNEIQ